MSMKYLQTVFFHRKALVGTLCVTWGAHRPRRFRVPPTSVVPTNNVPRIYPDCVFNARTVSVKRYTRKMSVATGVRVSFLGQEAAQKLDEDLMSPGLGWSIEQLMELAGLSCASSIAEQYDLDTFSRVLVLVGPGNNGGDGLVAARHLHHFGYDVTVCYPKRTDKALFRGLVTQLESLGISFKNVDDVMDSSLLSQGYAVVVDGLFGFSFKGQPKAPFDRLIAAMTRAMAERDAIQHASGKNVSFAVVSIDVPSGWHVEDGDVSGLYPIHPDMLISLTAPKLCAKSFKGKHHYLGGRFVPPQIIKTYNLTLPPYPGSSQCVNLNASGGKDVTSVRKDYSAHEIVETAYEPNPFDTFAAWFHDSCQSDMIEEPNAMALASVNAQQQPALRMVLLRGFSKEDGFIFYSNYTSRKGRHFDQNDNCSAMFYWEPFSRSVRVEGTIAKLDDTASDAYWNSRPRGHQLGALASNQSSVLKGGSEELIEKYNKIEEEYRNKNVVPRPPWWGGYTIKPRRIEFWQGRKSRLHERMEYMYDTSTNTWTMRRLAP